MAAWFCVLAIALLSQALAAPNPTPRERAEMLVAKMTQDEKLAMVHGYGAHGGTSGYVGM
jgi:hypothetical protein